ncbi:unnamed protein product, partial [Polarella glacialis]
HMWLKTSFFSYHRASSASDSGLVRRRSLDSVRTQFMISTKVGGTCHQPGLAVPLEQQLQQQLLIYLNGVTGSLELQLHLLQALELQPHVSAAAAEMIRAATANIQKGVQSLRHEVRHATSGQKRIRAAAANIQKGVQSVAEDATNEGEVSYRGLRQGVFSVPLQVPRPQPPEQYSKDIYEADGLKSDVDDEYHLDDEVSAGHGPDSEQDSLNGGGQRPQPPDTIEQDSNVAPTASITASSISESCSDTEIHVVARSHYARRQASGLQEVLALRKEEAALAAADAADAELSTEFKKHPGDYGSDEVCNIKSDDANEKAFQICPGGVLNPHWVGRLLWDFLVMFLVIMDATVLPFQLAFKGTAPPVSFDVSWLWLTSMFFSGDIVINFMTAYEAGPKDRGVYPGTLITSKIKIARNYFLTWFGIDLLGTVPWPQLAQVLTGATDSSDSSAQVAKLTRFVKFVRCLRLLRMLRLARLGAIWERIEGKCGSMFLIQFMALLRVLLTVVAICHWNACIWWLIGLPRSLLTEIMSDEAQLQYFEAPHWTTVLRNNGPYDTQPWRWLDKTQAECYVFCFYWTLGVMRTMPAEVTPVNLPERLFVLLFMFFALSAFAVCVAQITQAFFKLRERKRTFNEEMATVRMYLRRINVDEPIQARVKAYLRHLFERRRIQAKETNFLQALPPSMLNKLKACRMISEFNKLSILDGLGAHIMAKLYEHVDIWDLMPGDILCTAGQEAVAAWILVSGRLYLRHIGRTRRQEADLRKLQDEGAPAEGGDVMSPSTVDQECLLTEEPVFSQGTVVAHESCEVIRLDKVSFIHLLQQSNGKQLQGFLTRQRRSIKQGTSKNEIDLTEPDDLDLGISIAAVSAVG